MRRDVTHAVIAAERRRNELIRYYTVERSDWSQTTRDVIHAKLVSASDESILTDRTCVGKHWLLMSAHDRNVCPYCGWELTIRYGIPVA